MTDADGLQVSRLPMSDVEAEEEEADETTISNHLISGFND